MYLVVDETNRESGKDSSTLPITTTELPTVISDEFNATESTGYNHTVAFNITLGLEVEFKIDPDTLKEILNFMIEKLGDKFDQIIGRRMDFLLETAEFFTQLFGPLIGDLLKQNPKKILDKIKKNKFEEVLDFLSPNLIDEECPKIECPEIECPRTACPKIQCPRNACPKIECPVNNCPICPSTLPLEISCPNMLIRIWQSECTDYSESYPHINICDNQEKCQSDLFDCHWLQWFNRSQFWRKHYKPYDIPTMKLEDGTCVLREKLLHCLLELNFWHEFPKNP